MKKTLASSRVPDVARPGRLTLLAALMASLSTTALAVSPDVVISQVFGGGGNSGAPVTHDFVELFNRGSQPVSLAGWSVQYASATGASWQVTNLTPVTLQPGQYYLVQEAIGANISLPGLPTPDASGTIAMSATAGKVALVTSTAPLTSANPAGATVRDLVGFGSNANGAEANPAPAPSNALAILRAGDGCVDSDDNASDFAPAAPLPRNTRAPLRVCGAPAVAPIVPVCPATLTLARGSGGGATLAASVSDGIVSAASISAGAVAGIRLSNFVPAGAAGGSASVDLTVDASLAAGSYPVQVTFGDGQARSASCAVAVSVQSAAAVTRTIPQIQGAGTASPYANTVQTTEGVVTHKVSTGFFLQDPDGDGDPTTSDGIFVYMGTGLVNAAVGDKVRVTGTVAEYVPGGASVSYTELKNVTGIVTLSSGHSVTPLNLRMPVPNFRQVQGMLVRFTNALTVSQLQYLGDRGEVTLSGDGRLETPTNRHPARSPEAQALARANAANTVVLDNGSTVAPTVVPYLGADGVLRSGYTVSGLTGVIDFGATGGGHSAYKVQPTVAPVFSPDNPRTAGPELPVGNVKVASANLLNFFTTFANGEDAFGRSGQGCALGAAVAKSNCRGADSLKEFVRQRDKLVNELKALDADVVGLMEVQNNGDTTVGYLVDSLNAALGAATYAVVPKPATTGTDAIRVAMIYKPARLSLVGAPQSDGDAVNNRPPFGQGFKAGNGEKFSVIVNHMKSKGGCPSGAGADADNGDGQGCWNATRVRQAQRLLASFVPQVQAAAGDPDVLVIGDLNAYGMEDPIRVLTDAGMVNQLERFIRPNGMPYSFVFDGQSGYLDHALASASLSAQVAGAAEWHNNADEPPVIDYNLENKPQDLYTALPYRASDHDPVVVSLNLQPAAQDVTASFATTVSVLVANRGTSKFSGAITLTNQSGATLNGPFQVQLDGVPAGVRLDNASGSHGGAPYLTVGASSIVPGASVTLSLTFDNPAKVGIVFAPRVFNGSF